MNTKPTTTKLTEDELKLLEVFRSFDAKQRRHLQLAAESIRATAKPREVRY